jgi:putative nucleotidyltransferase with HDIG domain
MNVIATASSRETLLKKLSNLQEIPSIPSVVFPLMRYLEQPLDGVDMQKVVEFISHDKALAAQCLHLANSPLFGRWQRVENVRGAVVALGLQRMRDIVLSCSVLQLTSGQAGAIDPVVFWEHSLGCALIARQLARKINFEDREKAYLAGLLHDIGVIVNLWLLPSEFRAAFDTARGENVPLHEAELAVLGITHCESGAILAKRWELTPDLVEVVASHHDVQSATSYRQLVALVSLADQLCRFGNIGYGYGEHRQLNLTEEKEFAVLAEGCPSIQELDWARFTFELESYVEEVHRLVTLLYRTA